MVRTVPPNVASTWPSPNYKNPENFGNALLIVNVIFSALVTPIVCIRMYTRWRMRRWVGWDDFWCCIAYVFAIGFSVIATVAAYKYNSNVHFWDVRPEKLEIILQIAMASKALFTLAGTSVRQSLLCFYLRLIGEAGMKNFRWVIHTVTIINVGIGIAFFFLCIFQCTPVSAYWKYPSELYGMCLDEGTITLSCGIIITVLDVTTVLLPIPIIMRLQMSWRQKFGVAVLLNLGMAASAAASVRTYYIWKALVQTYDETWYVYPLWTAATVELDVSIMAACAPAIRPFVVKYAPWMITPVHKLGDLVSYIQKRGDRNWTEQSTTAVSEKNDDYIQSTAPMYGDNFGSSRSVNKQPLKQPQHDVERSGSSSDEKPGIVRVTAADLEESKRTSIDKQEVLHAVTQAIRGVGTLPNDIFASHSRPSRESHRRPSREASLRRSSTGRASAREASSTQDQASRNQASTVQQPIDSRPYSAESHSTIPLGSFNNENFDFENTARPASRLMHRTSGRVSASPGRTARPVNSSELTIDPSHTAQPRQDMAERTTRDMPNAFWNRERTKDSTRDKRRSRSLDVLHSRQAAEESSDDEEPPRDGLAASLSREASQKHNFNRRNQDLDPLTARLVRQYSIPGVKPVDVSTSPKGKQTFAEDRPWEMVDSNRASYSQVRRLSADVLQQSSRQQQTPSPIGSSSQQQTNYQPARTPIYPNNSSASWSVRNDPSRQHPQQAPPPAYSLANSTLNRPQPMAQSQPVVNRNQANREPPRIVRGVPDLSARGRQKFRQSDTYNDDTEDSEDADDRQYEHEQQSRAPQPMPDATIEAWVPVAMDTSSRAPAASATSKSAADGASNSTDHRTEVRSTFLFDDSVDDGGEDAALEMEALRREMSRRRQMMGGRR